MLFGYLGACKVLQESLLILHSMGLNVHRILVIADIDAAVAASALMLRVGIRPRDEHGCQGKTSDHL